MFSALFRKAPASGKAPDELKSQAPLPSPVKHVVVVGAGFNGLYAAIRLHMAGVTSITVIDPRAGVYTRPGMLNEPDIKFLEKYIPIRYDNPVYKLLHLKDAERALYSYAIDQKIDFQKKKFVGFAGEGKLIVTENSAGTRETLSCDYVLECTGEARQVVRAANKQGKTPRFTINACADNPVKKNLIAYGKMSMRNIGKLQANCVEDGFNQAALTELRVKFNWMRADAPSIRVHCFDSLKEKVCIYSEVPDTLQDKDKKAWLQAIFRVVTGGNDIVFTELPPSKKYGHKPRFELFEVNPQCVPEAVVGGRDGLPVIIPAGDAQVNVDYRLGISTRRGLQRINMLLQALTIVNGRIVKIDRDTYAANISSQLSELKRVLELYYKERTLLKMVNGQADLDLLAKNARSPLDLPILYFRYTTLTHHVSHQPDDKEDVARPMDADMLSIVTQVVTDTPCEHCSAMALKNEGVELFHKQAYAQARVKFEKALELLLTKLPGSYLPVVIKLYNNLSIIAKLTKDLFGCIRAVDAALAILQLEYIPEKAKYIAKLKYNKADAILNDLMAYKPAFTLSPVCVEGLKNQAIQLVQQIEHDKTLDPREIKQITGKLSALKMNSDSAAPAFTFKK